MLNQFHNSIIGLLLFLVSVLLLFTLSLNWANFKNLYKIDEINIYGTTFFDQSIIKEKSDILKSYSIFEKELKSFKKNVTTALWGVYSLVLGVIAKLIFWE